MGKSGGGHAWHLERHRRRENQEYIYNKGNIDKLDSKGKVQAQTRVNPKEEVNFETKKRITIIKGNIIKEIPHSRSCLYWLQVHSCFM